MAKRRMFSMQIIDSDAFMEMPVSSRELYFQLCMRADDEGFVSNPKGIMKRVSAADNDYGFLIAKNFIIDFEGGIIVIKHWLIHNSIRLDRYGKSVYEEQRSKLFIKSNNSYTLDKTQEDIQTKKLTHGQPIANHQPAQSNLIKSNLIKSNLKKEEKNETSSLDSKKEEKKKYGEFQNVLLTDFEVSKLHERIGEPNTNIIIEELSGYVASKGKRYSSHYATLLGWARRKVESHKGRLLSKGKEILL